jgi:hypothetical protein
VALDGASDADRIFSLAALTDVLTGGALVPDLRTTVARERRGVVLAAENGSGHASEISRSTNWIDVDLPAGGIRDVEPGGFDRYEVFDAQGRPVSLGRATRVRFYETLLAPFEKIAPARILLRRAPSSDCCRVRRHLLAASGPELSGPRTRRRAQSRAARRGDGTR